MGLKIYNTLSGQKEEFVTREPGQVRMYVCGVTVYDFCHIGHARGMLAFDVIWNYLEYKGYQVKFVRNFTDVDDKIIKRAQDKAASTREIAEHYIKEYYKDIDALGIRRAHVEPRATEHIQEMLEIVKALVDKGIAYEVDGDVFFSVEKFNEYGKLSGRKTDDMIAGARIEIDERKRNPLDFALWKKSKEGEPAWDSPWGDGRPGWHIECSAMSMKHLGRYFDIHGGGKDLIFPHHENEIAQSEAHTNKPFVKYWIHNGFVNINQEKMSKSLGNFFTIREVLKKYSPEVVRFFLISTHYRSPIDFSDDRLDEAAKALTRFYNMFKDVEIVVERTQKKTTTTQISNGLKSAIANLEKHVNVFQTGFEEAMDDDFNTAAAIGRLFEMIKAINSTVQQIRSEETYLPNVAALVQEALSTVKTLGRILGLFTQNRVAEIDISEDKSLVNGLITIILEIRKQTRAEKNWELADQIRDHLSKLGIKLKDHPDGQTNWERS